MAISQPAHPAPTITFLWSRGCEECRIVFGRYIAPFLNGSAKGRAAVVLVQHEIDEAKIDKILSLRCSSNKIYTWVVLSYLFSGWDEETARQRAPQDITASHSQLCPNKVTARKAVVTFLAEIKRQHKPSRIPAILLDGRELKDPRELDSLTK